MNVSSNGLAIIKKWEGCKLDAYLDPVGIPTIGYGTIAYPDGRRVAMGDQIVQEQAEGFLLHECTSICPAVERQVAVPLSQNQFDALVSFSYNVGLGAFGDSTLLRKLNQSDYAGAAEEFLRWNKGQVGGQTVELPGLTNRRRDERALFLSSEPAGVPLAVDPSPSPQQQVTWLEGFLEDGKTVIAAWNDNQIVEVVSLDAKAKRLLIDVLNQYPKAANFVLAPAGKAIPVGPRITITDRRNPVRGASDSAAAGAAPTRLLARGSRGEDVQRLQERLQDLGYYTQAVDGSFGGATDAAVRAFQADAFSPAEADGKVGPRTWAELWSAVAASAAPASPGVPGKTYLRLTRSDQRDQDGLCILNLDYIKNGEVKGSLQVCSGAPSCQKFRIGAESRAGSMEPLPEGRWSIRDIAWKAGKDVYGGSVWGEGLGPVSTPIDYVGPGQTERAAIEIHIDWNKRAAPGTAGCIGINTVQDYKLLVGWLRDSDPRDLYVDWGLGSCPQP